MGCASGEGRREPPRSSGVSGSTDAATEIATVGLSPLGSGTAFLISDVHVVTSYHVVENGNVFYLAFGPRDNDRYTAQLVAQDPLNDLAILEITDSAWRPRSHFRISDELPQLGLEVFTIGFPLVSIMGFSEPTLTTGVISRQVGIDDDERFLQITAPIQPGNSGGPLLNERGEVVGVIASKLSELFMLEQSGSLPQNVNFAVKADLLSNLIIPSWRRVGRVISGRGRDRTYLIEAATSSIGMLIVAEARYAVDQRRELQSSTRSSSADQPIGLSAEQFEHVGRCNADVLSPSFASGYDTYSTRMVTVKRRRLDLKCAPDAAARTRGILRMRGESLPLIGESLSGKWVAISAGGVIGWVDRRGVTE